jgi:hypothetical protein
MRGEIEVRIMLSEGDWTQRTITSRPFNSLRAAFNFVNRFNKGTDYTSDVFLEARVFSKDRVCDSSNAAENAGIKHFN